MGTNHKGKSVFFGVDLVILDMDGTLYQLDGVDNSMKDSTLYNMVIANSIKFVQEIESCGSEGAQRVITEAIQDDIGISAYLSSRYAISREEYFDQVWNIDPKGIVREYEMSVEAVKKIGIRKILLTSAPKVWQERVFQFLGLNSDDFEEIYTGGMYGTKNDVFRKIMQHNDPYTVLSVGDQIHTDIEPAEKLGMKTYLVKHPNDLARLVI